MPRGLVNTCMQAKTHGNVFNIANIVYTLVADTPSSLD